MNTADKLQAALLVVQILVGVVQAITTFFFIRSVRITGRQEKGAREQIELAQDQMSIMSSQYRESLRPLITVSRKVVGSNTYELELRNDGLGPALKVECAPQIHINGTVIGTKGAVTAYISKPSNQNEPHTQLFNLTYQSIDNHTYVTSFHQQNGDFSVVDYRPLMSDADREEARAFQAGFVAGAR